MLEYRERSLPVGVVQELALPVAPEDVSVFLFDFIVVYCKSVSSSNTSEPP